MLFKKIKKIKNNKYDLLLNELKRSGKDVILYGSGVYAYVVYKYINAKGIKVSKIVVDKKYKNKKSFLGKKIYTLESILKNINKYKIIIGFPNYPKVIKKFKNLNLENFIIIDVPDFLNIPKKFMDYSFIKKNRVKLEKAYNLLDDKLSKRTFINSINTKLTGDVKYLFPQVRFDHLYFTKENFPRKKQEVLLDVGGYNGDSIKDLHNITSGNYNHIISLEPFPKMFKDLKSTIKDLKIKNRCSPIQIGAWSKKTELSFTKTINNIDSKIEKKGNFKINVDRIDSILSKINHSVTFIKLDINGAEFNALKGASETIKKNKPFIAVKMHVKEDFYRIPILLKKISPTIKLKLRQRNFMSMMLVLYGYF